MASRAFAAYWCFAGAVASVAMLVMLPLPFWLGSFLQVRLVFATPRHGGKGKASPDI